MLKKYVKDCSRLFQPRDKGLISVDSLPFPGWPFEKRLHAARDATPRAASPPLEGCRAFPNLPGASRRTFAAFPHHEARRGERALIKAVWGLAWAVLFEHSLSAHRAFASECKRFGHSPQLSVQWSSVVL